MAIPIPASLRRRGTALLAAAAISALLAGCGSGERVGTTATNTDKNASVVDRALPPSIIRDATIRRQKQGSPGRALLEWWQAFQFRDVPAMVRLTSPRTLDTIGRGRLERVVRQVGPGLQGINVLSWRVFDGVSSVRVELLSFAPRKGDAKPPDKPTSASPSTFLMRQGSRGRGWLFDDAAFLRVLANNANL